MPAGVTFSILGAFSVRYSRTEIAFFDLQRAENWRRQLATMTIMDFFWTVNSSYCANFRSQTLPSSVPQHEKSHRVPITDQSWGFHYGISSRCVKKFIDNDVCFGHFRVFVFIFSYHVVVLALALVLLSITLGWPFGYECRHDFESTTVSGKVWTRWFNEHGRTCRWRAANATGGNVTCGAISQSPRHCRQRHYHCIWNDLWIIVTLEC